MSTSMDEARSQVAEQRREREGLTRREFKMTQEDMDGILKACQPVPYIVVGGLEPLSPQRRANIAWDALGGRMGFVGHTVQPVSGKSQLFFTAEPLPEP